MRWASIVLLGLLSQPLSAQFDPSPCARSKGCLFSPPGCTPNTDCIIEFSYVQTSEGFLEMELAGRVTGDGFVAVGFSTDSSMGDDMVVFCRQQNGRVQPGLAYNQGRSNTILDSSNIQQVNQSVANNGNVYCSLRQQLNPSAPNVKSLDAAYTLLMSMGPVSPDGALGYHNNNRFVLPQTDFRAYKREADGQTVVEGQDALFDQTAPRTLKDKLLIAHGILMTMSWSIFLATGILFARHFRGHWPETTLFGVKMWFHMHRTLNMIGLAGTICGFVIIFVAHDWQWIGPKATQSKEENDQWNSVHAMVGLLACVVAWAQPLNAVFRCHPGNKARFIFNYIHRFFGCGAFVMAATAIMIACVHFNAMFSNRDAALGLFIAYISVLGLTLIALEILSLKTWWSNRRRTGDMEMVRVGGSSSLPSEDDEKTQRLQLVLLAFFVVVAIGCSVAISVLIGLKPKA